LFGYDLNDYNTLFAEKLDLLLKLRDAEQIHWNGKHRAPLAGQGVYPRPHQEKLPIWVAVGGTPQSVVRAGTLGLPLALAIIGGLPEQFAPLAELYWEVVQQAGHNADELAFSINAHGFIADDERDAADTFYPGYAQIMSQIGRERGWSGVNRQQFEASRSLRGANFVGNPAQVIEKILYQYDIFHHQRLLLQISIGSLPHAKMMRAIELLGTEVAPVVRREVAQRTAVQAR